MQRSSPTLHLGNWNQDLQTWQAGRRLQASISGLKPLLTMEVSKAFFHSHALESGSYVVTGIIPIRTNSNLPNNTIHLPSLGSSTPSIKSGFGSYNHVIILTRETYNYDDSLL